MDNIGEGEEAAEVSPEESGSAEEYEKAINKRKKKIAMGQSRVLENEVAKIKELKREVEDIQSI